MNEIIDKVFYSLFQTNNEVGYIEKYAVAALSLAVLMFSVALIVYLK